MGLIQNRYYLKALYGWTDQEKFDFFHKYYKNVLEECEFMPNAVKVLKQLKEEGHTLIFITARLNNVEECKTEQITKDTFRKEGIEYEELIINASDKLKVCQEKGIDLLIEDSYETCDELLKAGFKTILMTTRMNEKIPTKNLTRVTNWKEIYQEIQKQK